MAPPPSTSVSAPTVRMATSIPLGAAIVGLGGLLVLVGGFLPHVQISFGGASAGSNLVHEDWHVGAAIAVGIGLVLLAIASVVQPRQPGMVGLQGLTGFAALVVGLLDWNTLSDQISQANDAIRGFASSVGYSAYAPHISIGLGVWSVIVGGIVAIAGSVVSAIRKI